MISCYPSRGSSPQVPMSSSQKAAAITMVACTILLAIGSVFSFYSLGTGYGIGCAVASAALFSLFACSCTPCCRTDTPQYAPVGAGVSFDPNTAPDWGVFSPRNHHQRSTFSRVPPSHPVGVPDRPPIASNRSSFNPVGVPDRPPIASNRSSFNPVGVPDSPPIASNRSSFNPVGVPDSPPTASNRSSFNPVRVPPLEWFQTPPSLSSAQLQPSTPSTPSAGFTPTRSSSSSFSSEYGQFTAGAHRDTAAATRALNANAARTWVSLLQ